PWAVGRRAHRSGVGGARGYRKPRAGPPAAKTRRTGPATSTRRPALSTMARGCARTVRGATSAATAAPRSRRRVSTSVLGYDDVRGLDDRIGGVAPAQAELVDRFDRDPGLHDRSPPHVDLHVGGRRPPRDFDHSSLHDVSRAELHHVSLRGSAGTVPASTAISYVSRLPPVESPQVPVQVGLPGSEDATISARVEAEHAARRAVVHRAPAGGGRDPDRGGVARPAAAPQRSRKAWGGAGCLAPVTTGTG